jgi:zinc protease
VLRARFDNGLQVLLAPHRAAPVVAMQAWVHVGSADETDDATGIAHVFEHMLFKGTRRRGVGEIARDVEGAGGEINAWTSFNQTVYHVVLASRYFDTALDVVADALLASSFDPVELEREREVILEEIRQGQDDPGRSVAQALFSTAFVRHPYGRPVIGTAEAVRALTRDHLLDFYRTWYVPNNMTLVIAGDFDPEVARARVAQAFAGAQGVRVPRRHVREPRQTAARSSVLGQDVREAQLALGFHIPPLRAPETAALDVLAIVLGQGESSRLATVVRRRQELVTGVYAYAHSLRDPGLLVVGATLTPDRLDEALGAIAREVFRLAVDEIEDAEIEKARRVIRADTVYQQETAQGAARKLGFYESVAGDAAFEATYLAQAQQVTAAQVREVAERFLDADNATLAALVPEMGRSPGRARAARGRKLLAIVQRGAAAAYRAHAPSGALVPGRDDLVRDVLPNGVRVVVKRSTAVPVVAVRAVWTGGLRQETAATNGINHLLAVLVTRGCGERNADDVVAAVDEVAGALSGFSGRNTFGLRSEWLAPDWERGFQLTAECILDPRFPHAEFLRQRRRTIDELASRLDNPSFRAFRLFAENLYRRHPYRMDVLGSPRSVAGITRKQLVDYYRQHYPVSTMTIAVVGDVDPKRVLRRARALFGGVAARRPLAGKVEPEDFAGGRAAGAGAGMREVYEHLDRQQAHLVVGFPGTTVDDADRHALEVLTTVLSGQGGRLFLELRDKQSLAYRIGAFSVEGIDPGYVAVYLACSPEKLPAAYAGIREELRKLVDEGITAEELERAVKYLVGTHEISLQRRSSVASALAFHEAYGLGYDHYTRYAAAVQAVTTADVRRVATEYLSWDLAVVATVKPPDMSPEAARRARGKKQQKRPAKRPARRRRAE